MSKNKKKKVGFQVLVYWHDKKKPDVLMFHQFTEKALYAWIDSVLADVGDNITHVAVNKFYY